MVYLLVIAPPRAHTKGHVGDNVVLSGGDEMLDFGLSVTIYVKNGFHIWARQLYRKKADFQRDEFELGTVRALA